MTSLEDLIKKSKILTIEGNRNSGKSTFIFYIITEILKESMTVFSPIEDSLFERKLKIVKKNFNIFENLTSNLKFFFLDEDWLESKQLYGFDFFRVEMEKLIQNSVSSIIYLHRFGEFFELQDLKEVEPTLSHLMKIAERENKKLFFSINSQSPVYNSVSPALRDFSDITLFMKEQSINERLIEIQSSVMPLFHHKYLFISSNNLLVLMPYDENEINLLKEKVKIVLVTDNKKLQKFFKYIFEKENFIEFHIFESFPSQYSKILADIDLLLLNSENNRLKIEIPEFIKRNSLKTKVFYLSNKDSYRLMDEQMSYKQGFKKVFTKNFHFEDLVFSIEKEIGKFFYFDKFEKIVKNSTLYENLNQMVFYNKSDFFKKIKIYLSNNIYFTIFIYKITWGNIKSINVQNLIRDHDSILIDNKESQIIFLCLNSRTLIKDILEERLKKENLEFKEIKQIQAQDIEL